MTLKLYVKVWCPWCVTAQQYLDARGYRYELIDVERNRADYDEMIRISGQRYTPTLAVGDLNADSMPDIALANYTSSNATIHLSDAAGGLTASGHGQASFDVASLAVADYNNDGRIDAALSTLSGNQLDLFAGDGHGNFGPPIAVPVDSPRRVVAGEFNGLPGTDLAVSSNSNQVFVMTNDGNANFAVSAGYAVGAMATDIVAGRVDADTALDLVVCNRGSDTISVLLGRGDGTFQAAVSYPALGPYGAAIVDLNWDGYADVVVPSYAFNEVNVYLGNGDGTLQAPVHNSIGAQPTAVATADLDNDGHADLVVANNFDGTLSAILSNGTSSLSEAHHIACGAGPSSLVTGDFNGDAKQDVAVLSSANHTLALLLGNNDGTLSMRGNYAAGRVPVALSAAWVNDDAKLDVLVVDNATSSLLFLMNTGCL
ncbi:MAG: hypothetical protein EOP84_06405 [Verrucomicrobiaceae bacterium]|nr:MAG: hypothetical protein EOP84_06405 [Verrucomicrobiaceae bacterium]